MTDEEDDRTLTRKAADGDDHAFRLIYRRHVRPVYWIAHGLLSDSADAEDVTQETFVVAWRRLRGFELAGESLLPWLATICRFQAANRLRARRRERERTNGVVDETFADTVDVEDQVISAELADRIERALEALGEVDARIFRLCAVEGYAYAAAADEIGISHGAVRNRLSRIRTGLRSTVREEAR